MIIVTGESSGLGKAIAEDLRSNGEQVVTFSRREEEGSTEHISCDIADHQALKIHILSLIVANTSSRR